MCQSCVSWPRHWSSSRILALLSSHLVSSNHGTVTDFPNDTKQSLPGSLIVKFWQHDFMVLLIRFCMAPVWAAPEKKQGRDNPFIMCTPKVLCTDFSAVCLKARSGKRCNNETWSRSRVVCGCVVFLCMGCKRSCTLLLPQWPAALEKDPTELDFLWKGSSFLSPVILWLCWTVLWRNS